VSLEIRRSSTKYPAITEKTNPGVMVNSLEKPKMNNFF
jgi:hypothetical protein